MFSPNCVVVVPSPEISIKSAPVRGFMLKKLHKVMELCLKHVGVVADSWVTLASRVIITTNSPQVVLDSLRNCFGINSLALAQEVKFSSLENLLGSGVDFSKGVISSGTFAIRGKSFVREFSSKELEIALGSALIDAVPSLKVNLSSPERELFCIVHKEKAFFYFEQVAGAMGMPLGSQGKAGFFISEGAQEKEVLSVAKNILKVGCSLVLVSQKPLNFSFVELESFNGFRSFNWISLSVAMESFLSGKISAFFSSASTFNEAKNDSKVLGVKVFAPLLF